ncbi:4487_t:CDS:1, partial [Dentiscutata erythropus]
EFFSNEETPVKKTTKKKKESKEDLIEQLVKQFKELKIEIAKIERPQNNDIKCCNCEKRGHFKKDCRSLRRNNNNNYGFNNSNNNFNRNNYQNNNTNNNNQQENRTNRNENGRRNNNQYNNRKQYNNRNQNQNNNNQNNTPINFISIEETDEYNTDKEVKEITTLLNENFDSFGNLKRRTVRPEVIYDYKTDPKRKRNKNFEPEPMEWTPNKNKKKM